jgi:hypothetical protein
MSLAAGDQAQIIGVGLAAVFALGAAIWKTASLRGDVAARWARRVDFAVAALDEKTIRELERLRDEVDEVLPAERRRDDLEDDSARPPFDPAQAIADPSPLSKRAEKAVNFHRTRTRMEAAVVGLMRVGRAAVGTLGAMALACCGTTVHYAELVTWSFIGPASLVLCGGSLLVLVGIGATYVVLQDRLASAEDLAGTAGRAELGTA